MLVINKDFSWYTMDDVTPQAWLACFGGVMPEEVAFFVESDSPLYEKIISGEITADAYISAEAEVV